MSADKEFVVPAGQRQLFIDGHGIESMDNLARRLHQPSKKGAVIRPDFTRGERGVQTRSAPHWDPEMEAFRLLADGAWYRSGDGIHWTREDRQTRGGDRHPAHHLLCGGDDAGRRYKGFTMHTLNLDTGQVVKDNSEIADPEGRPWPGKRFSGMLDFVVSADGVRWKKLPPSLPSGDEQNLSYDPLGRRYIATLKRGGTYGRSHAVTTSRDFENWSEPELTIQADALDQELGRLHIAEYLETSNADYLRPFPDTPQWHWHNVDIYNAAVFRYEGIFLALPALYHARGQRWTSHTLRFTLIQLWCSRDLRNWSRVDERRTFIPWSPGASGAYDLNKNMPPSYPLVRGDQLWFYYTGGKEYSVYPDPDPDRFAVCLALLRRDGFVSVDAGGEEGTVLTRPFTAPGGTLRVNADARHGRLKVEVTDQEGQPLAASGPIEGDHPRLEVPWSARAPTAAGPVRLRFTLRRASLYSYWFE